MVYFEGNNTFNDNHVAILKPNKKICMKLIVFVYTYALNILHILIDQQYIDNICCWIEFDYNQKRNAILF